MPEPPLATPAPRSELRNPHGHGVLAGIGAMVTAFLGSICCIGPLLLVTLGIGAGWASIFEPLRSVFAGLTIGLLSLGFYTVYGRPPGRISSTGLARGAGQVCRTPVRRRHDEAALWVATVVALLLLSFPAWSKLLV